MDGGRSRSSEKQRELGDGTTVQWTAVPRGTVPRELEAAARQAGGEKGRNNGCEKKQYPSPFKENKPLSQDAYPFPGAGAGGRIERSASATSDLRELVAASRRIRRFPNARIAVAASGPRRKESSEMLQAIQLSGE